ncbi:hypothetical protein ACJMK2_016202 [Sinanodonta woodiana]|uniref:VWFA domain-containing protein n=1 Tax=Sinanodonta woodiana TaxID=1069815 RepID=A0ABD3UVZ0_SINWO
MTLFGSKSYKIFKVECYNCEDEATFALIGEFSTNLSDLSQQASVKKRYEIINTYKKIIKKSYKNSGECILLSCKIETEPSFLDFIQGGTEVKFAAAIDFTDSNGDPYLPTSLHYNHPHQRSPYGKVIKAIGEIIQDYDTEKLFPVLGFGAILPDGTVSHEFPCSLIPNKPYCQGIQGMLDAYDKCLRQVRFSTPTNLAPVINHIARFASATRDASHYFVMLIVTKGSIADMPNTIKAVVDASYLPMSIIIVGVGNDKLEEMEKVLNGESKSLLSSGGKVAERNIVQVEPLKNFVTGESLENPEDSLANKVLSEIPTHFLSYMKIHEFKPKPLTNDPTLPPKRPFHPTDFSHCSGGAPRQQQQQQQYRKESSPDQAEGGIPIQPQRSQKQCDNVPKL